MLPTFDYIRPASVGEALAAASERPSMFLAGGQGLLSEMARGLRRPERLVDLGAIEELRDIREVNGHVETGALVKLCDVAARPVPAALAPLAASAARVGSEAIRSQATVGGNLCHGLGTSEIALAAMAAGAEATIVHSDGTSSTVDGQDLGRMRPPGDRSPYLVTRLSWPTPPAGASIGVDVVELGEQRGWLPAIALVTVASVASGRAIARVALGFREAEKQLLALEGPGAGADLVSAVGTALEQQPAAGRESLPAEWLAGVMADSIDRARTRAGGAS